MTDVETRRAAALRALANETTAPAGADGPPADTPEAPDERSGEPRAPKSGLPTGAVLAIVIGVLLVVGVGIGLVSTGGDSGSGEDVATANPEPAVEIDDAAGTDPAERQSDPEIPSDPEPVELPELVGAPAPTFDSGTELESFAADFADHWLWLQANPSGETEPLFLPGSPAQRALAILLDGSDDAGRVVVFPGAAVAVTDAHDHGETANIRVMINAPERVVLDSTTGEVIETVRLPGGELDLHATLRLGPFGWQVAQIDRE